MPAAIAIALLADAHIMEARREALGELGETRAGRHAGRDRVHAQVALGELDQRVAEGLGEGRAAGRAARELELARVDGERRLRRLSLRGVDALGVRERLRVALALLRQRVQQHDAVELAHAPRGSRPRSSRRGRRSVRRT
jgi:hypothetical protein